MIGRQAITAAQLQPTHPRMRWLATRCLLTLVFVALALVTGEILVRMFIPVSDSVYYFWDPVLGPRPEPNQTGIRVGKGMQGSYHFNAQGWNHPRDYIVRKQPPMRRVCLVGDSFVEAKQVPVEETHFMVAERLMNRPDRPVQWYAFGCSGLGTAQEYQLIRHYVLDYKPDTVIMLFFDNDLYDCSPYLLPPTFRGATYELAPSGTLDLIPSRPWYPSRMKRLAARSALLRHLVLDRNILGRLGRTARATAALHQPGYRALASDAMTVDERGQQTWLLIEALLREARDACARRGATFMLAYSGSWDRMSAAFSGETYTPPPRKDDPYCLDPNKRWSELGHDFLAPLTQRLSIPYLDLTEPIVEEVTRTGKRHDFPEDKHYGPLGHAVAGKALARWVEDVWEQEDSGE